MKEHYSTLPVLPGPMITLTYRVSTARRESVLAFLREATPLYERPGGVRVALYESAEEPGLFVEVVAYASEAAYEADQERVEKDPEMRAKLSEWRALLEGPVEVRRLFPLMPAEAKVRAPDPRLGALSAMLYITEKAAQDGRATFSLEVMPELLNPNGVLHGGAVYTLVDYSMGAATMSVLSPSERCATLEIKINYLFAVQSGVLTADTQVLKRGRGIAFLESRVTDEVGKLVATASGTFAIQPKQ